MPKKIENIDFCPADQKEWRSWLEDNHDTSQCVWLIIYKKGSGKANLTWSEAVDQALCFGWIDSTKRPIDHEKYMQYFGKRKATSTWSKINKDKIDRLRASGLMREAGLKSIDVAKENGSWTLMDSVERLEIPDELEAEFAKQPGTKDLFLSLSKSVRKTMLHRIVTAKRTETKRKRVLEIVGKIKEGLSEKENLKASTRI